MATLNTPFFEHHKFDSLSFDDVLLEPRPSDYQPSTVKLESRLGPSIPLKIPFLSADMDTVTEDDMAIALAKLGGLGFLWKHDDVTEQAKWVKSVKNHISGKVLSPITVSSDATIGDAKETLKHFAGNFSTLVVTNPDGEYVGLFGRKQRQFASSDSEKISDYMQKNSKFISHSDFESVGDAYEYLKEKRLSKVVILDDANKVKALYCYTDARNIVEDKTPLYNTDANGQLLVGANVGAGKDAIERSVALLECGADALLVGTSKGDSSGVLNTVREVAKLTARYDFDLVAGNIASFEGAKALYDAGADTVKVGIGPGSICTTRIISGTGAAQLSAIYNASRARGDNSNRYIIADGGIKQSGDIVKAFAAGADSVMMGSMLAGTHESPGDLIYIEGQAYKSYRGMGSLGAMERSGGAAQRYGQDNSEKKLTPEGIEGAKPLKGDLASVVTHLVGGIQSGMGQIGAKDISNIPVVGKFIRISLAALRESHVHNVVTVKEAPNYRGE